MKTVLTLIVAFTAFAASSQVNSDTTYWETSGNTSINFSEVSFSNWASGGQSSVSGVGLFNLDANYTKANVKWENAIHLGYGLLKEGENDITKSEDKIELDSKLGLKSNYEKLSYTALFNFLSQFANGYNYPNTSDEISGFLAPAYLKLALGADYKPSDKISIFFSPVSGKLTVVNKTELAEDYGLDAGKKSKGEFGATFQAQFKTPVVKNVELDTKLNLFSNYLDTPQNIDVKWDLSLNMKINDFLSANFVTNLIYDDDIMISYDDNNDGVIDGTGQKVQFKHILGIGLSYNF